MNSDGTLKPVPMVSGELTPDKLGKKSVRWSKIFGNNDEGTVDEAGTSQP
jgi:hypothetical protein